MKSNNLRFENIYEVSGENFDFTLSVKFNEGHIFLCSENSEPPNSKCYWFVLGGWGGTKTVLRKCEAYRIPNDISYASGDCNSFRSYVNVSMNYLLSSTQFSKKFQHTQSEVPFNRNNWKHITIKKLGKVISLTSHSETFFTLSYTDDEDFYPKYLYVSNGYTKKTRYSEWIIHKCKELSLI